MKMFDYPGNSGRHCEGRKNSRRQRIRRAKMGEPTPVDEFTLFGIGSNTKAFTTAALATLVDEGKLSWDEPV